MLAACGSAEEDMFAVVNAHDCFLLPRCMGDVREEFAVKYVFPQQNIMQFFVLRGLME